jgi:hypothetical protein
LSHETVTAASPLLLPPVSGVPVSPPLLLLTPVSPLLLLAPVSPLLLLAPVSLPLLLPPPSPPLLLPLLLLVAPVVSSLLHAASAAPTKTTVTNAICRIFMKAPLVAS